MGGETEGVALHPGAVGVDHADQIETSGSDTTVLSPFVPYFIDGHSISIRVINIANSAGKTCNSRKDLVLLGALVCDHQ